MADFDKKVDEVRGALNTPPGLVHICDKRRAVGAEVAIPVPVIGPIFGAIAGAAYAYHKGTKNK